MRLRRSSTFAAAALLWAVPLASQDRGLEQSGAAFLLIPVGARATALGQAGAADYGTSESAFWNPAGLAHLPVSEVAIHHATTFVSINTVMSAYYADDRFGSIGIAAYLVDYGTQEIIPPGGMPGGQVGRLSPKNLQLLASYATDVAGPLAVGVSYKLIQFRQDCQGDCGVLQPVVGTTHAVDVGVQYVGGVRGLAIGAVVRHAGFRLQLENREQADPLPTRLQMGASYQLFLPTSIPTDERIDLRVMMDVQEAWGVMGNPDVRVGAELGYGETVRLRAGYAFLQQENSGPSVGVGVRMGRIGLDFARVFFTSGSFDEPVYLSLRILL